MHNLRKAENEVKFGDYFADTMGSLMSSQLSRLQEERLKLVLLANLAFEPTRRGESFPHANIDEKVKVRPAFLSIYLCIKNLTEFLGISRKAKKSPFSRNYRGFLWKWYVDWTSNFSVFLLIVTG